jgi:hypothetical protein
VFCTDITGGVYASVSSSDRVRSGMSVTHGGGLAHSEASMYEKDGSGWFDSILEEGDDGNEDEENDDTNDDDAEGGVYKDEGGGGGGMHGGGFDSGSYGSSSMAVVKESRNCCRVANITGRGLACAVTPHGYLGVTGSDGEDDHALRLFDLRLAYSAIQLRKDGV